MKARFIFGVSACALLLTGTGLRAQSDAAATDPVTTVPSGLLGRTYLSLDAGAVQVRHEKVNPTGLTAGADLNLPITDGFDYRLGFGYEHAAKTQLKLSDAVADNAVTYYYRTKVAAPYLTVGLGYAWDHDTVVHTKFHQSHLEYEAGTGVEVPVSKAAAVRLGLGYDESARSPHGRTLGYDLSTNYWFNDTVGASVGAMMQQGRNGAHDALLYTAGVHFSFD